MVKHGTSRTAVFKLERYAEARTPVKDVRGRPERSRGGPKRISRRSSILIEI
jgi:hypothetical protein